MRHAFSRLLAEVAALLRRPGVWTGLKIALAALLIAYIGAQIRPADLLTLWQHASLPWLIVGLLVYAAVIIATALRYWLLIDRQVPLRQTVGLVVVQTVLGNFFASSAGLASYVAILRGRHQVRVSQAVWSVLVSRMGDLVALLAALSIAAWAVWPLIAPLQSIVAALLGVLGAAALVLALVFLMRQRAAEAIAVILAWTRLDRLELSRRALAQIQAAIAQPAGTLMGHVASMLACSALIAALQFAFSYAYAQMLAVPISGWGVLFVLTFSLLISLVPIQVFGGLGVYEVTAIYLYSLMGVRSELVVPMVVSSRIYLYLLNLLLLLYLPFENRIVSAEEARPIQEP